jgi:hypothetical protein
MTTMIINSDATFGAATRALNDIYITNKYCTVNVQTGRQRTGQQNNAMYPQKKGTSSLNTDEVSEVANVIIRHLAEKRGLNIPFPSKEELDGYKKRHC